VEDGGAGSCSHAMAGSGRSVSDLAARSSCHQLLDQSRKVSPGRTLL
jgi:hypothetical protein